MEIETGQLEFLADGRVSRVYRMTGGHVLKLLHATVPEEKVKDEFQRCRIIYEAGVRSPKPLDIVEVDGLRGIVFEWAGEKDLFKAKLENPLNIASAGRFMANAHLECLACRTADLPDIKEEAAGACSRLPDGTITTDQQKKLEKYVADLPEGGKICHMDFHPGNIMLDSGGYDSYQVIDWSEALRGSPEADIAMTCLILNMAETSPGTGLLLRILIPIFRKMFENYYRNALKDASAGSVTDAGIKQWELASAVFRMHFWNIESEYHFLRDLIRKKVDEL